MLKHTYTQVLVVLVAAGDTNCASLCRKAVISLEKVCAPCSCACVRVSVFACVSVSLCLSLSLSVSLSLCVRACVSACMLAYAPASGCTLQMTCPLAKVISSHLSPDSGPLHLVSLCPLVVPLNTVAFRTLNRPSASWLRLRILRGVTMWACVLCGERGAGEGGGGARVRDRLPEVSRRAHETQTQTQTQTETETQTHG